MTAAYADGATAGSRAATDLGTRRLVLLAFIAATSPLAVDLYLASFPAIQTDLGTSRAMVQLTLTAYLAGIAIGQPIWGPLSDRFGRRAPLVVSNAVTVVSSVAIVLAPTIELLVVGRFVQALSAASGMVIARAMVSDLAEGYSGVRALSLFMTVHGATPVIAPVIGAVLATFVPWRGVLAVLALVMLAQLVVSILLVAETLPPARRTRRLSYGDLARVVRRPAFLAYGLTVGFTVSAMMAYVATASFVYQEELGFSALGFGAAFAATALGMATAGALSARLARRQVHPARTVAAALPVVVLNGLLITAVAASPWPALVVLPVLTNAFGMNLVMSNCMGLAMEHARGLTGAGSAVLGLLMFGMSALAAPVPGLLGGSAVAMGLVMTGCVLCAAGTFAVARWWVARRPGSEVAFA